MLNKPFLKIIAGIENRNAENVLGIIDAAVFCKVSAIDICDDEQIIKLVKNLLVKSETKLFVSSLDAKNLVKASKLGVDYLELGNYDHLYPKGLIMTSKQILEDVNYLLNRDLYNLSVTVPGYLSPNEQADLAQELYESGVPIIQTEGGSISKASHTGAIGQIEKAKITLANTIELKIACPNACIMSAGGLSSITIPLALSAGASGIGIGKAISNLSSQIEMVAAIRSIQLAMNSVSVIHSDKLVA